MALEWLRATDSHNPGAQNLAGRFLDAYDCCECACEFLPGLEASGRICFYCDARPGLEDRMCIDHFLPADYVGGTEAWNLVLACQGRGRKKVCMLPSPEYIGRLTDRNAERRCEGAPPAALLDKAIGIERAVERHYGRAKKRGYGVAEPPAAVCP